MEFEENHLHTSSEVRKYGANYQAQDAFFVTLKYAFKSLLTYRWLISQTFKRDFKSLSNVTQAGTFWNFVLPLVPLGAYVMLMALRMFPTFGNVSGIVYITSGVTVWFLLAGLVRSPISVLEKHLASPSSANTPSLVAIVSGITQLAFETLVRFGVVIPIFFYFQGLPSIQVILVPFVLLCGVLLFSGLGIILGLLNLALRDISKITGIFLTYGLFFSGVIFPLGSSGLVGKIMQCNPFFVIIENVRSLAIGNGITYPVSLSVIAILSIIVFAVSVRTLHRSELRLRGWIS